MMMTEFGSMGFVMPLMMILFWGLILTLLFKCAFGAKRDSGTTKPLDIAKARYARGEINIDELQQIKQNLG